MHCSNFEFQLCLDNQNKSHDKYPDLQSMKARFFPETIVRSDFVEIYIWKYLHLLLVSQSEVIFDIE